MKRKIDKYDPVVYPRLLWVATEITDLDKMFVFCNINDFTLVGQQVVSVVA